MAENQTWTIRRILDWSKGYFANNGIETPQLDAQILLGRVLDMGRMDLVLHGDRPLDAAELASYKELVIRRAKKREPVAYILGEQGFWSLDLKVTPDVLIPRADTECLVEQALAFAKARLAGRGLPWPEENGTIAYEAVDDRAQYYADVTENEEMAAWAEAQGKALEEMSEAERVQAWEAHEGKNKAEKGVTGAQHLDIFDVGTGSGAIVLALASELGDKASFWAGDISAAALNVARENAEKSGAGVTFVESDLLDKFPEKADLIVSNPPYITTDEMAQLQPEVRCEPVLALAAGKEGMDVYRRLVPQAVERLKKGGALLVEIGYRQSDLVESLFRAHGLTHVRTFKDYGKQPRVVFGLWEGV